MRECPNCWCVLTDSESANGRCPACDGDLGAVDVRSERPASPVARATAGTRACPMCGSGVGSSEDQCHFCGETLEVMAPRNKPRPRLDPNAPKQHRGWLVLTIGLLGILAAGILAPLAWTAAMILGFRDLAEMRAGRMDPSGRGLTIAGILFAMIQCIAAVGFVAAAFGAW